MLGKEMPEINWDGKSRPAHFHRIWRGETHVSEKENNKEIESR